MLRHHYCGMHMMVQHPCRRAAGCSSLPAPSRTNNRRAAASSLEWGCRFVCLFIRSPSCFPLPGSQQFCKGKRNTEISGAQTDGRKKTQGQMRGLPSYWKQCTQTSQPAFLSQNICLQPPSSDTLQNQGLCLQATQAAGLSIAEVAAGPWLWSTIPRANLREKGLQQHS